MSVPVLRFKDEAGEDFPDWVSEKLGKIGAVLMCKRILKEQTLPVGDVPFYKIGTFGKQPDAYITNEIYKSFKEKYSFPKKGDILISAAGTIGRTVVFDGLPAYFQDSNIVWIDNNEVLVKNAFLYYVYANTTWNTENTTIARLYNDNLKSISISFPSLPEQTKIANFLSAVDEKITQLTQKHDLLTQYKKGVMQQIFSQELRFKDDDGRDFPEWEEKELRTLCDLITKGTTPTSVGHEFKTSGINFIKIESLEADGKLIKEKLGFIDADAHAKLFRSQLKLYDLLFSIAGALGRVAIVTDEFLPANTNQALAIIRLSEGQSLDTKYVFYTLTNDRIKKLIESISVQLAQANLSLKDIGDFVIELPCIKEQTKIANFLTAIDDKITATQAQLDAVKQYKQGLLQQMFV